MSAFQSAVLLLAPLVRALRANKHLVICHLSEKMSNISVSANTNETSQVGSDNHKTVGRNGMPPLRFMVI